MRLGHAEVASIVTQIKALENLSKPKRHANDEIKVLIATEAEASPFLWWKGIRNCGFENICHECT
jgi:hypothetical protein